MQELIMWAAFRDRVQVELDMAMNKLRLEINKEAVK